MLWQGMQDSKHHLQIAQMLTGLSNTYAQKHVGNTFANQNPALTANMWQTCDAFPKIFPPSQIRHSKHREFHLKTLQRWTFRLGWREKVFTYNLNCLLTLDSLEYISSNITQCVETTRGWIKIWEKVTFIFLSVNENFRGVYKDKHYSSVVIITTLPIQRKQINA